MISVERDKNDDSGCGCLILVAILLIGCSQCHQTLPTPSKEVTVACEKLGRFIVRSASNENEFHCIAVDTK